MRKPNLSAYHLIDEELHGYGNHEESGWDTDHRGAGASYPATTVYRNVKSVNTEFPTFRRRNITEEISGCVTVETTFRISSGDGFYFGLYGDKDNVKEAFVLRQSDGYFKAGTVNAFKADGEWHYLKLEADIDRGECKIHLDGKYVMTSPFTGKAKSVCRLEYGYEKEALGETIVSAELRMYKNYIFNDVIVPKFDGELPQEYVVSKASGTKVYRRRYSENSKYSVYEVKACKNSVTQINRCFERASGVFCYEMKYLAPEKDARLSVSLLCAGEKFFTLYDEGASVFCRDGKIKDHTANVWQTLRLEADTESGCVLVRLNGKIVTTLAFDEKAEFVDGISLSFDSQKTSTLMITHLKAFIIPPLPDDYVPEPVIPQKKSERYVGMNVCSLWRTGSHYGWDCITPFEDNKPVLGFYDEGITETADWELKYMAEHGIDFQLYCWYASEKDRPMVTTALASAIYDGHMLAKYSDKVKIALLWEAQCAFRPQNFEAFKKYFVPYFIDYFFSDSRYMTIDGSAIMSIYGIRSLVKELGSEAEVKRCLDYLRREVRKCGYKDLIIMCCGDSCELFKKCGVDGAHAYNWGKEGYDAQYTMRRINYGIAEGSVHTVPTVSMGYNLVAWKSERSAVMEPEDMKMLLNWCCDEVLSKQDKKSWKSKLVMLSTWNEYGEGTYIMPAKVHGFGYLDAIRSVFMKDTPHTDIIPTESQLDRICIIHPRDRRLISPLETLEKDETEYPVIKRYEFKTQKDLEKWEIHKLTNYEIRDGRLCGHSDTADPYMILHDDEFLPVSAEKIGKIVAHCRTYKPVNAMCCIQCSYMLEKDKWYPYQSACLSVPDKVAPLAVEPRASKQFYWHGELLGFRFDPVWAEGDFELESIEFHAAPPHWIFEINGKIVDLSFTPYVEDGVCYIPFDTKSPLKDLACMYYEWSEKDRSLTVYSKKTAVFTENSDTALLDGKKIQLNKPIVVIDGIPHIPGEILSEALGMVLTIDGSNIKLNDK